MYNDKINKKLLRKEKTEKREEAYMRLCIENKTCPKCADRIEFNSNETLIGTNWFFHTKTYETTEGCTCSTCGWNNVKHWTYTFSPQY